MLTRSSTELVRQRNSGLVLQALRLRGRLSHTEIADLTGLASATISAITSDLEHIGAIEKSEQQAATGRGRPRVLFTPRRTFAYLVVVIISSDAMQLSLADYEGKLIDRFSEPRQSGRPGVLVEQLHLALLKLVERSGTTPQQIRTISISSKGIVDEHRPVLLWSPILGGETIDFAEALADRWPARVLLSNETLLLAHALTRMERERRPEPFAGLAVVSLGHSIGLGLSRRTSTGEIEVSAPNFGHMLHVPNGALCRCGVKGCIEAYAGFYAILRNAFEVPKDTIPARFVPVAEVDKLATRARAGERMPAYAFREAGLALGQGLSRLLSISGPLPITFAGLGARHFDLLRAGVEEGLSQAQVTRMVGLPELSVALEEPLLVFEGHLQRALAVLDEDIVSQAG